MTENAMPDTQRNPIFATVIRMFPQGGYGFATTADGREVYFHEHVVSDRSFATLNVGDLVELELAGSALDEHTHAVSLRRRNS